MRTVASGVVMMSESNLKYPELDDESMLREMYYGKGMNVSEISDSVGAPKTTIRRYMENNGIDRRQVGKFLNHAHLRNKDGYLVWATKIQGEQKTVRVHRLVAVAEYGAEYVKGKSVHHKNGVRWDNRPENLEVMSPEDHSKHHYELLEKDESGRIVGEP